jgi:hypothetical protein
MTASFNASFACSKPTTSANVIFELTTIAPEIKDA